MHREALRTRSLPFRYTDSDADPKHSEEFNATFTAEHMPKMAYPSPSVDPGEYSPGSTAETRRSEVQQLIIPAPLYLLSLIPLGEMTQ